MNDPQGLPLQMPSGFSAHSPCSCHLGCLSVLKLSKVIPPPQGLCICCPLCLEHTCSHLSQDLSFFRPLIKCNRLGGPLASNPICFPVQHSFLMALDAIYHVF